MLPLLPLGALALSAATGCSAKSIRAGKLTTPTNFAFAVVEATAIEKRKQIHQEIVASWTSLSEAGSYELCYDIATSDVSNPGTPADWVQRSDQKDICTTIAAPATTYNGPFVVSNSMSDTVDVTNPRLRAIPKAATSDPSDFATATVGDKLPAGAKGVCSDKDSLPDDVNPVAEVTTGSSVGSPNALAVGVSWKADPAYVKQAKGNKKLTPVDKFVFEVCAGYVQEHDPATNVSSVLNCTVVSGKDAKDTSGDGENEFYWSQLTNINETAFMSMVVSVRVTNVCAEAVETLDHWATINSYLIYAVKPPFTPGLQADNDNELDANNINMVAFLAMSSRTLPSASMSDASQRLATAIVSDGDRDRKFNARLGAQGQLRVGNTTCLVADGGAVAGNALIVDTCLDFWDESYNNRTKWVADVKAEQTSLKLVQGATELCVGFTKTQSKYEAPLTLMACDAADDGQKFSFKNSDYQPPEKTEPAAATSAAAAPAAAETAPAS